MTEELEWKTRKERIDKRLTALKPSWEIVRFKEGLDTSTLQRHAVTEYPTENGPADYALFVKGKLLGIIEAKEGWRGASECPGAGEKICERGA